MASLRKRGKKWQALVRIDGKQRGRSFHSKAEAANWAAAQERGAGLEVTVRDTFERYRDEVSANKPGERWERIRIGKMLNDWPMADRQLVDVRPADITAWRDHRLTEVQGSSVRREMALMSHVFNIARKEWGYIETNPVSSVSRPKAAQARTRVFTDGEIESICVALGWADTTPQSASQMTAWAFLFSLETAMRASEVLGMTWGNVGDKSVHLPMTKNGTSRDVPLTKRARVLVEMCRALDETLVLPLGASTRDALFRRAMKNAGVVGARFHDARRTATIRLAKKVDAMTLAKITGHRDLKMLLNVYYGIDSDDVADRLD